MPATFMNFASFSLGAMMKSSPVLWARMPANEVMTSRVESDGTDLRAVLKTPFVPSAVVEQSSFSSMSTALGPTSRLPSTVGVTRTPLPIFEGHWNIVCFTLSPTALSMSIYSPLRGIMVIESSPMREATLSQKTPAALTTYSASISPASDLRTKLPCAFFSIAVTSKLRKNSTPFMTAFSTVAIVSS